MHGHCSQAVLMSISDFELEDEAQGYPEGEGEDKKLEEVWSRKVWWSSSQLKLLVEDYLNLKKHKNHFVVAGLPTSFDQKS